MSPPLLRRVQEEHVHMIDKLSSLAAVFEGLVNGTRCDKENQREDDTAALQKLHNSLVQTTTRLQETKAQYRKFQKRLATDLFMSASSTSNRAISHAFQEMERSLGNLVHHISSDLTPDDKPHAGDSSRAEEAHLNGNSITAATRGSDGSRFQGTQNWITLIRGMQEFADEASVQIAPVASSLQKTVAWLYADLVLLQSFSHLIQENSDDKHLVYDAARRIFVTPSVAQSRAQGGEPPTTTLSHNRTPEGFKYRAAERRRMSDFSLSAQARMLQYEREIIHNATKKRFSQSGVSGIGNVRS
jgi:hypothetical protein